MPSSQPTGLEVEPKKKSDFFGGYGQYLQLWQNGSIIGVNREVKSGAYTTVPSNFV